MVHAGSISAPEQNKKINQPFRNTVNRHKMTRQIAKNGYYTRRYTSNIIAVIDGIGYIVAYIPNRKTGLKDRVIMNERVIFSDSFITSEEFVYEPFADKKS